jgi:formamidopyrimidine-DNA glycosylase
MPEIAEVRILADKIRKLVLDKVILHIAPVNKSFWEKRTSHLGDVPLPLKVIRVETHGKFCWIELEDGGCIGIGFGMSGDICTGEDKHNMIKFEYCSEGGGDTEIFYYNDLRRFGMLDYYKTYNDMALTKLSKLGPDLLRHDESDIGIFKKYERINICRALMEQKMIAGVGNYILNETLYACRISPHATVKNLTGEDRQNILQSAKEIANRALSSTYSDFKTTLAIYGKSRDLLGNQVVVIPDSSSPDKRTKHWVPSLQIRGVS